MTQRQQELAQELTDQLRGLEDKAIGRIGRIWQQALRNTIEQVRQKLDRFAEQPEYDPETTPGAFLGSTPDGPVPITPDQKNLAAIGLEGPLLQDLRFTLSQLPLSPRQVATIDGELSRLFDQAQDLGTEYALELTRAGLEPALEFVVSPPNRPPSPWPDREYREGQRFTQLFDMAGSIAAAQRDFRSLSENYRRQRNATTDAHVKASKNYYYKWWRQWGESVSFETATQMAAGPDPRVLKKRLEERLPTINDAFRNRAEVVARTETLMASGEAQERTYRALRVGFVQWEATEDERVCEWCAPRAGCIYWLGSVKAPIHPQCVLGETQVSPGVLIAATRGVYSGDVVTITTGAGHSLSCTKNHLVLTEHGWIPAHLIHQGMKVAGQAREVCPAGTVPDLHQQPARAKDLFNALATTSPMAAGCVPPAAMHFHGDGRSLQGQIDVVWANRELMDWLNASCKKGCRDLDFELTDAELPLPSGLSPHDLALVALHSAASGFVGRRDLAAALLIGHLGPLEELSLLSSAWRDSGFDEPLANHRATDASLLSELIDARPCGIALDDVIDVKIEARHDVEVFDFSTVSGAYIADGIVTHNCRCNPVPITLESLVIQNAMASKAAEQWEQQAQKLAADTAQQYQAANGIRTMKPVGGPGESRGERDYPLMERTSLPQTKRREALPGTDTVNAAAAAWPRGTPVWCPRRGWLDPAARQAYEAIQSEVADL
jgi:hypothetical protein